jgi:hypothetical protein
MAAPSPQCELNASPLSLPAVHFWLVDRCPKFVTHLHTLDHPSNIAEYLRRYISWVVGKSMSQIVVQFLYLSHSGTFF